MNFFIFFILELLFFFLIRKTVAILLFHHFPDKVQTKIKEKTRAPFIKNKGLYKLIDAMQFDYIGIRKEYIFKVFSFRYFLYKNDKNHYLDISEDRKFYYISYFRLNKLFLHYKKHLQITPVDQEVIQVAFIKKGEALEEVGENVSRESLSKHYYKHNPHLISRSLRLPMYFLAMGYVVQFFYLFIKWLI